MEPITTASVGGVITGQVAKAVTKGVAAKISKNFGRISKAIIDQTVSSLQIGFGEFMDTSYEKCRYFKTILDANKPIETVSHYINVNVSCGKKSISDDDLIDNLGKYRRVVLTGLAGGGKSMFMKYLTVRYFEQPRATIPMFVELRHINNLSKIDLLSYIRTSCSNKKHYVSQDQFEIALKSGCITLIMDGFDELNYDIRDNVQHQLLSLEKDFPNAVIIISSRPDQRFDSWQSYFIFSVDALTEGQMKKLINSLEYSNSIKKRFLKEVDSGLIKTHNSFLSSPLLASIMLLTFEEFAEIPQKMNAFYDRAFDTLFQKHDAQKQQYKRKTYTSLPREEFKILFSTFSAMTYIDQKFSFTEFELIEFSDKSIKYASQINKPVYSKIKGKDFISDMFESVCMLKMDGLEATFSHRSFQEYFAALFAANLRGEKLRKFLDKYASRITDSAVGMAAEISRGVVEAEWVLPSIDQAVDALDGKNEDEEVGLAYSYVFPSVFIEVSRSGIISISAFSVAGGTFGRLEAISRLYNSVFSPHALMNHDRSLTMSRVEEMLGDSISRKSFYEFLKSIKESKSNIGSGDRMHPIGANDGWWLKELGVHKQIINYLPGLKSARKDITGRIKSGADLLDEFF